MEKIRFYIKICWPIIDKLQKASIWYKEKRQIIQHLPYFTFSEIKEFEKLL